MDVMVSVLAIKYKVCGFKPGRDDGLLRAIKFRRTPFFGGEVKPEASCKIYGMLKSLVSMKKNILCKAKFIIPFARTSSLVLADFAGRIARELGDE
jgi:hypothetical protein